MNEQTSTNKGFLLKIESVRQRTHAQTLLLKGDDIIVALNNEFYLGGENTLIEELTDSHKKNESTILTILRNGVFFDLIARNSLGCKFINISEEETQKIQDEFSKKKIFDIEELKEFKVLRDLKNNFDCIEKSYSLSAGLFPPAWLAYEQQWWILGFFSILSILLIAVNPWIFIIGWMISSIYCYKAQKNLLISFALLSGKAFTMELASPNIHHAQETVRRLFPRSYFKFSKLDKPNIISEDEKLPEDKKNISESQNALV